MISAIAPFLLFVAFLLLLLVSLSVPIIKSIWLFSLTADVSSSLFKASASATLHFGVWGYCSAANAKSIFGSDSTTSTCSKRHLGYTFDATVAEIL
jgi:hypothetical protein